MINQIQFHLSFHSISQKDLTKRERDSLSFFTSLRSVKLKREEILRWGIHSLFVDDETLKENDHRRTSKESNQLNEIEETFLWFQSIILRSEYCLVQFKQNSSDIFFSLSFQWKRFRFVHSFFVDSDLIHRQKPFSAEGKEKEINEILFIVVHSLIKEIFFFKRPEISHKMSTLSINSGSAIATGISNTDSLETIFCKLSGVRRWKKVNESLVKATSPIHKSADPNLINLFCSKVNEESEGHHQAIRLISHKIQSPQEHEALRTLELLEVCAHKCGKRFQQEMGKFRFLNEMIKLVSPKVFSFSFQISSSKWRTNALFSLSLLGIVFSKSYIRKSEEKSDWNSLCMDQRFSSRNENRWSISNVKETIDYYWRSYLCTSKQCHCCSTETQIDFWSRSRQEQSSFSSLVSDHQSDDLSRSRRYNVF